LPDVNVEVVIIEKGLQMSRFCGLCGRRSTKLNNVKPPISIKKHGPLLTEYQTKYFGSKEALSKMHILYIILQQCPMLEKIQIVLGARGEQTYIF
jgi:hypothetical protein